MKYGNGLSKEAVLKVPSGAEWKVELTKLDDDVCFQKGWREFMDYYSIKEFHFLLFRYDGNSHFYVVILDGTATEIDYPFNNSHGDQENMLDEEFEGLKVEETESDSSVEILGEFSSSCPKTRDKSPLLPFLQPHKMVKTHPSNKIGSTSNSETLVPCSPPKCTQPKMKKLKLEGKEDLIHKPKSKLRTKRPLTTHEKAKALQKASAFKTKNPSFLVVMQPAYSGYLCIPTSFVRRYLNKNQGGDAILWNSDGKNWTVKYTCRMDGARPKGRFNGDWIPFAQDNNLDLGDVCAFELIKANEMSFKVSIFH